MLGGDRLLSSSHYARFDEGIGPPLTWRLRSSLRCWSPISFDEGTARLPGDEHSLRNTRQYSAWPTRGPPLSLVKVYQAPVAPDMDNEQVYNCSVLIPDIS